MLQTYTSVRENGYRYLPLYKQVSHILFSNHPQELPFILCVITFKNRGFRRQWGCKWLIAKYSYHKFGLCLGSIDETTATDNYV